MTPVPPVGHREPKSRAWAGLAIIERAGNVVLLGPSGVGKTHLACVRAYRVTQPAIKTRVTTAADLTMQLASARQQNRLRAFFNRAVVGPTLGVFVEIGYLPFGREDASRFFNVAARRYARGARVLTSHLPLTQWAPAFADDQTLTATMPDRRTRRAKASTAVWHPLSCCLNFNNTGNCKAKMGAQGRRAQRGVMSVPGSNGTGSGRHCTRRSRPRPVRWPTA